MLIMSSAEFTSMDISSTSAVCFEEVSARFDAPFETFSAPENTAPEASLMAEKTFPSSEMIRLREVFIGAR